MDFISFSWIDYILFVLMFGISAAVGVYYGCFGKQQKTSTDYLLGGKRMKVFPVAMSLVASNLSGISLLAIPSEVYAHGTKFMMVALGSILGGFLIYSVYLPVFWNLQITNMFEYLQLRFNRNLRMLASALFTLITFIHLPMIIYAPSLAFNQVTGVDLHTIAIVMSLLCIFYTTIGGLKAVVWADTLQLSITLCSLAFVLVMGTISIGGLRVIWQNADYGDRIEFFNMDPDVTARNTFWTVSIGAIFFWLGYVGINPATTQRFRAVPTLNDSKKVLVIFMVLAIITKTICCFSGLIMYAKYFDCDPLSAEHMKKVDQILPYFVQDVAAQIPGLSGLFVAGLFSTALSTLSTILNSLSGVLYVDFISPFMTAESSEKKGSTYMKIIAAAIGCISIALVFVVERLGSILELIAVFTGVTLGPLLGVFTLGILFPIANRKAGSNIPWSKKGLLQPPFSFRVKYGKSSKGALFGLMGSFLFMAYIIVGRQIHVWNGAIKHVTKPLYTHGCNATLIAISELVRNQGPTAILPGQDSSLEVFWLFRISYHYYLLTGTFITIITGVVVSWFTKDSKQDPVNADLLSPCVHRFINKSVGGTQYASVEQELHVYKIKCSKAEEVTKSFIDEQLKK